MNKSLRNDFLGTEGEFDWHMPDWLGKWVCQMVGKHKDTYEECGSMNCFRCSICLFQIYYRDENLRCPDCQMNSEQYERYANCDNDECQQECING